MKDIKLQETTGDKLRDLRGNRDPHYICTKIGISPKALEAYETNKRKPRDEIKERFSKLYRIEINELFPCEGQI